MPAGFFQLNDFGSMLIDDTNPSLALRSKTTLLSNQSGTYPGWAIMNPEIPSVAARCATPCYPVYVAVSGGTRTHYFNTSVPGLNRPIDLFYFDRPIDTGLKFGMQLKDTQGRLTFDAAGKTGVVANLIQGNASVNIGAGRSPAGVLMSSYYKEAIEPGLSANERYRRIWKSAFYTTGSSITLANTLVTEIHYASTEPVGVLAEYGSGSLLVLDVTSY
jgi:hypothetical protein